MISTDNVNYDIKGAFANAKTKGSDHDGVPMTWMLLT